MKKAVYFIVLATLVFQTGFLSGLPVRAQGEVTPTPTESPTATDTPEPTPTTDTPLPTETPTATATASATPSATATATETASATPTVPPVEEEITLSIDSSPNVIRRGATLRVDWRIKGIRNIEKGMILRFYLPSDVIVVDPKIGTWNEKENTFEIELSELKGSIELSVGEKAESPLVITAELLQDGIGKAKAEVSLLESDETLVESKGGSAEGLRGKVKVTFPDGALNEAVKVTIGKPSKESLPDEKWSGTAFEITAESNTPAGKMEVSEFSQPVEIQVAYSEAGMTDESDLMLVWYDPTDGQWKLPLSQRVDKENNLLIAYTNHFTVFDTYNSNWQTAVTPTLAGFQHSGFTGAASYSMPIKVPAGPGGFQPSVTLSYSSSVVDNASSDTQASWVGMGWSLTTSYIERNGHGTNGLLDDTFQLNLNGMSVELLPGTDGKYHSSNENFYKVEYNLAPSYDEQQSTWTISDKTGNKYYFEHRTNYLYAQNCENGYDLIPYVWRWSLTRVVNAHGQEMEYSYQVDTKNIYHSTCNGRNAITPATIWVYPYEIKYSNDRYRIFFTRSATRLDYKSLWASEYTTFMAFQKSKLTNIRVEQDANGDGTFETLIRRYDLTYANLIFPDYTWEAGGKTLALRKVQEFGADGVTALPETVFTYGDKMHLTNATNGYGGTVTNNYEGWHETIPFNTWANNLPETLIPEWGRPIKYQFTGGPDGWVATAPYPTSVVDYVGNTIKVAGVVQNPNQGNGAFSFQPGRWYVIVANVRKAEGTGAHTMQLGFRVGENGAYHSEWGNSPVTLTSTTAYQTIVTDPIYLSENATSLAPRMNSVGYNQVRWYYVYALPTAYRVRERIFTAGGNNYTYGYEYGNAATNRPLSGLDGNSAAADGTNPYIAPYTEFRGHDTVTETDPYGKETVTNYDQSDCLSGSPISVEVYNGGVLAQSSTSSYLCDEWAANVVLTNQDTTSNHFGEFYNDIKYRWTRAESETSTIYSDSGTPSLNTTYDIYDAYGNLRQKTVSGTDIDTLTTIINYSPNVSGGRWLVGLPSRVYVQSGGSTIAISLNLYDYHTTYGEAPTEGRLTGTRTWVGGSQYTQASLHYDIYGNVDTQTAYTEYGTVSTAPQAGAQTTTIAYDPTYHTYPTSITNALQQTTNIVYNYTLGVPTSETGPNGAATKVEAEYDTFGRLLKLIRPGDSSASPTLDIDYTDTSPFTVTLTQKINDTQDYTIARQYDGMGRPSLVTANGTILVNYTYGYNADGKREDKQSVPHTSAETVYWSKVKYDSMGRPSILTAPDGSVTSYEYDGMQTTVTDANGNDTTTISDILGRTLSVTPEIGPNVIFSYDALGNLTSANRGGAEVTMAYDKAGRKTGMDDPDMGAWTYGYDALGNLKTQTDARGCVTTLQYDLLNRLTNKSYSSCPSSVASTSSVTYGYDSGTYGIGQRTSMSMGDSSSSASWEYDFRGRLRMETKTIDTYSNVTRWTYNSADLPATMTYYGGEVVTYEYNDRMELETVIGDDTYVSNINYDSAGRMTLRALGNGKNQIFGYYDWNETVNGVGQGGRLESLFTSGLQNMAYQYDAVGNVKQIVDARASETSTYEYDELNRLRFWTLNGVTEEYKYDLATGNLSEKNGLALTYPAANGDQATRPHAATSAGGNTYGYDQNGNQNARHIGNDDFDLTYDAENRLVEVEKNNATIAQFVYNGDGQKVKTIVNGETIYLVNGYYEKKGSEITKYYFAGASRVAMRKYTIPQSMEVEYMLGDHLGSTSVTTDSTGAKVSEMRYKPWGEVRYHWLDSTLTTTPAYKLPVYTFTGQRSYVDDPSTVAVEGFGLMDYNARMYDPMTGRFIQADSIVPGGMQGLDRYAYVNNSPVNYVDPSGHLPGKGDFINYKIHERRGIKINVIENESGSTSNSPLDPEIEEEFWEMAFLYGEEAAIKWLAALYGITLPAGVTWAYTDNDLNGSRRGFSPAFSKCEGSICDADNKVYITKLAFADGDFSVVLNTMLHEARHAEVEAVLEARLGRNLTQKEMDDMKNAMERDADAAVYQSGIQFSTLAKGMREDHFESVMSCRYDRTLNPHYYLGTCGGGSSPTQEIVDYFIPRFLVPDPSFSLPDYKKY